MKNPDEKVVTEGLVRDSIENFLAEILSEPVRTEQLGLQISMEEALSIFHSKYL